MTTERLIALLEEKIQECESEKYDDAADLTNHVDGFIEALRWTLEKVEEEKDSSEPQIPKSE